MPAATEAVIAPGQAIRASWNFLGGRGAEIEIKNLGPGACEFLGPTGPYVLRAGRNAVLSVLDGTHELELDVDSTQGTKIRATVVAWRPVRRVLGVKKEVVRDPKTKLITGIITSQVWVEETP
jgi:hypothetical protein